MLKHFCGAPLKIYLHEYLTQEYFHTRKFPDLRYILLGMLVPNCRDQRGKLWLPKKLKTALKTTLL